MQIQGVIQDSAEGGKDALFFLPLFRLAFLHLTLIIFLLGSLGAPFCRIINYGNYVLNADETVDFNCNASNINIYLKL